MIKIWSGDGGGIRGIIPFMILAWIEKYMGKPASEIFDFIVGASTSGIGGLGMTVPGPDNKPLYSANQMVNLYEQEGGKIFPQSAWRKIHTFGGATEEKYPSAGINLVLKDCFGDVKMSQATTKIMIPAYDIERRHLYMMKSWRGEFQDMLMRDAARGTSAAPVFFEPHKINKITSDYYALIDGGMGPNNPAQCAYAEALRTFRDVNDFLVVSMGTGTATQPILYEDAKDWGIVGWAPHLIDVTFDANSDAVDYCMRVQLPKDRYFRFQPVLVGVNEAMDDASPANIRALKLLAENYIYDNKTKLEALCDLLAYQI